MIWASYLYACVGVICWFVWMMFRKNDGMGKLEKNIAKAFREMANRVETNGLRSAEWSVRYETIKIPSYGDYQERRSGPHARYTILLDWAHIVPADPKAGEISERV